MAVADKRSRLLKKQQENKSKLKKEKIKDGLKQQEEVNKKLMSLKEKQETAVEEVVNLCMEQVEEKLVVKLENEEEDKPLNIYNYATRKRYIRK